MISDTTTKILTPRPLPTSKTPFDHNKIENGFFFASKTPNNVTAFLWVGKCRFSTVLAEYVCVGPQNSKKEIRLLIIRIMSYQFSLIKKRVNKLETGSLFLFGEGGWG